MWEYNYNNVLMHSDNESYHHGVLGMKWGIRKKPSNGKVRLSKVKNPRKRWGFLDAGNSAARTHYKKTFTNNFGTFKKQDRKLSLKEANLTKREIDAGRLRVSRARTIKRSTLSAALGTTAAKVAIDAGATFLGGPLAVGLTTAAVIGSHAASYGRDWYNYSKNN